MTNWNKLWQCTQIARQDGFNLDLCSPDYDGNRVGILFRFFSLQQINDFMNHTHLRSDILLEAYDTMKRMLNGEILVGTLSDCGTIDWQFE